MKYLLGLWLLALSTTTTAQTFAHKLAEASLQRTQSVVTYDGSYYAIAYPNGDIPKQLGVCTDVIIRAYRALDIDLQQLVHQDIKQNFNQYPSNRIWGLTRPDTNIDHRRVPNLRAFFKRHGKVLTTEQDPEQYQLGDIVTWRLDNNLPHIGIIATAATLNSLPLVVHNIGAGPQLEDMLFDYKITVTIKKALF